MTITPPAVYSELKPGEVREQSDKCHFFLGGMAGLSVSQGLEVAGRKAQKLWRGVLHSHRPARR